MRLNHAAVIVAIAGGMLWIEHRHQIVTDAPTSAELDARAAATACPDNENVPYGENCIVFMQGGEIVEISDEDEIFDNPKDPRTRQFLRRFAAEAGQQ